MKPIKEGDKQAITRDGRLVTQLTWFDCSDPYCVVGVVEGSLETWKKDGKYYHLDSSSDIFAVQKYEWQWFYRVKNCDYYETSEFFESEADFLEKYESDVSFYERIEDSKKEVE